MQCSHPNMSKVLISKFNGLPTFREVPKNVYGLNVQEAYYCDECEELLDFNPLPINDKSQSLQT